MFLLLLDNHRTGKNHDMGQLKSLIPEYRILNGLLSSTVYLFSVMICAFMHIIYISTPPCNYAELLQYPGQPGGMLRAL